MIQPEGLYAAFKKAPNPTILGRLGFALAGREDELDHPLDTTERWMFDTMFELNKWHSENREALKEKWKKDKTRQRGVSTRTNECPRGQCDVHTDNADVHVDNAMSTRTNECPRGQCDVHTDNAMSTTLSLSPSPSLSHSLFKDRDIRALPTAEEMKYYANQIGAGDYLPTFIELMKGQDWAYINPSGNRVSVGKNNFKTVLGSFYRQEKRNNGNNNRKGSNRNEPYHEEGLAKDVGI